ncbi:MAG: PRC-barrel domain-containing protein [Alphaproteobacteria bacterium]
MTKRFLIAVSVLAVMAAAPAMADTDSKDSSPAKRGSSEASAQSSGNLAQDAENAWEETEDDVSDTAKDISEAAEEAYQDIRASLFVDGDEADGNSDASQVVVDRKTTAAGIIGQPVYNQNGDRVAKVDDIILDDDGNAEMVILADGEWTGLGKLAAFDYSIITRRDAEGDIIAPLTEEMIRNAASFSYDRDSASGSVTTLPDNTYSVARLLDAQLINPQGEEVADVNNVSFRDGSVDRLIVEFGGVLGFDESLAVLDYNAVEPAPGDDNDQLDFKLSDSQARQFEDFKEKVIN